MEIDIKFKHNDLDFEFKATIARGTVHTFNVGEEMLCDKLFWVLCGLDKNFDGTINGEGVCFNASSWNNVLALGDKTMFVRGNVRHNIYMALRARANRKTAKQRTQETIDIYGLGEIADANIASLSDEDLMRVAIARAHFRKIALVVSKTSKIDLSKWPDAYIINIT